MRTSNTPGGRGEGGFTLIEVLVVLVILGLSAALLISRGPARSTALDLRSAASQVAQALREARGEAIATNRPVAVMLDVVRRSLSINNRPAMMLAPSIQVTWTRDAGDRSGAAITFAPDGSADGGRITLAESARRVIVVVDWLTGRVSVVDAP